jgi:4-amino-4-deoxy-L-arabinose transferase-like glycosyltransferase
MMPMDENEQTPVTPPNNSSLLVENLVLKQRLDEMQQRLQALEQELSKHPAHPPISLKTVLSRGAVPLAALLLALVPPLFVMLNRWMGQNNLADIVRQTWCKVDFLCSMQLPSYFLYVFIAYAALIALLFIFQIVKTEGYQVVTHPTSTPEKQIGARALLIGRWLQRIAGAGLAIILLATLFFNHIPGWDYVLALILLLAGWVLVQVPLTAMIARINAQAYLLGAVVLVQVALALLLARLNSGQPLEWVYPLLFILALGVAFPVIKRIHPIVWVIFLAEILYTIQINSWIYSIIGDEFSFFGYATDIVRTQNFLTIGAHLFNGTGVYGSHPYFSSLLQAISMALLGVNNFGWRFSSLFLAAISIGFFYLFFKNYISTRLALIVAILLAGSQYVMNFGKIGYNNLQALLMMGIILWASSYAVRHAHLLGFFILGLCMGGSFYVYPAALYVLPVPILFLLIYMPPSNARALRRWAAVGIGLLVLVCPLFFQPAFWQSKVAGTIFYNPSLTQSAGSLLYHFVTNLIYSFFSYVYTPEQTHFVITSYVDLFTAIFIPIGVILLVKDARREKFALFILLAFLVELFFIGATHDRLTPSTTRMFLLLPWFFYCAAFGLDWIARSISHMFSRPNLLPGLVGGLLVICLVSNLFQAYHVYRTLSTGSPNLEVLFLRMLQHDKIEDPNAAKSYLFITQSDWGIDGIRQLQEIYSLPDSQAQLLRVAVENPDLPASTVDRIQDPNTLVIIQPWMEQTLRTAIENELSQLGKSSCQVSTTPLNSPQFTLWYSPNLAFMCTEANENY